MTYYMPQHVLVFVRAWRSRQRRFHHYDGNDSANPCARLEQRIVAHHGQGFSQIRALLAFLQAVAHRILLNSGPCGFFVVSASLQARIRGHP